MLVLYRFLRVKEVMKSAGLSFFKKKKAINDVYIALARCACRPPGREEGCQSACVFCVSACVRVCCYSSAL